MGPDFRGHPFPPIFRYRLKFYTFVAPFPNKLLLANLLMDVKSQITMSIAQCSK